ncbi:MAG: hypothetical protein KF684_12645 [Phycisphaeraceae bacterium]|nr:hypothetical protein [Phycisphaeraceae bacterium]
MLTPRCVLAAFVATAAIVCPASLATDAAHREQAREMIDRALAYLRTQQDAQTGGWAVNPSGPNYPAITGLVVRGMLLDPRIDARDESVRRGVEFMLRYQQPDGGIYDRVLPSYNTALCLSALALVQRENAAAAIKPAQDFLRSLQWSEQSDVPESTPEAPEKVTREHPFYGGMGYGRHGRPDLSNTALALQALHDSGLSSDDPAFQRALVFLARCQMVEGVNDMPYAQGSSQGGFIYSTSINAEQVGSGQTQVGVPESFVEETMDDGTRVSRLRAYGSMTYAGFKSMLYANLSRDDVRVREAYDWMRRNYTLEENPQIGTEGMYYYLVMFSRAMDAWGDPHITPLRPAGGEGVGNATALPSDALVEGDSRVWGNDLVQRLAELQNPDGSFRPLNDRWMENNPVLITAYALNALQHAVR